MGTHPIFESDFDCLTEKMKWGLAMCILPTYIFFIRRQFPKLTRKLEFLLLAEILSIPTLIVLVLTRGGYELLRWVPRLLSWIFNCQLKYSGTIVKNKNVIFIVNHQSGMDVCRTLTLSHNMAQHWQSKV